MTKTKYLCVASCLCGCDKNTIRDFVEAADKDAAEAIFRDRHESSGACWIVTADTLLEAAIELEAWTPDDHKCDNCGELHPPCSQCGAPTRCPPGEEGDPYTTCDDCDAKLAKGGA